jgi:zinc transporter 1/2/3
MAAVFFLFFAELIAFRWGTAKLAKLGANYDTHGHGHGYTAHGPEGTDDPTPAATTEAKSPPSSDAESQTQAEVHHTYTHESSPLAQIVAVIILEFGVVFHSVIIGLTLAVDQAFKALFTVIVFHQMFEGLGLGTRLAALKLPPSYKWTPLVGAIVYGLTTPVGIAAGLGVRHTYSPNSTTALIVSGVFDCFSSGILLYTGLVELLAHEFLFNKEMTEAPIGQVAYAAGCVVLRRRYHGPPRPMGMKYPKEEKGNIAVSFSRRARRGFGLDTFLPVPRPTLLAVATNHDHPT